MFNKKKKTPSFYHGHKPLYNHFDQFLKQGCTFFIPQELSLLWQGLLVLHPRWKVSGQRWVGLNFKWKLKELKPLVPYGSSIQRVPQEPRDQIEDWNKCPGVPAQVICFRIRKVHLKVIVSSGFRERMKLHLCPSFSTGHSKMFSSSKKVNTTTFLPPLMLDVFCKFESKTWYENGEIGM